MAKQKFEWLPEHPKLIGVSMTSGENGVFSNWDDVIAYMAECYGDDTQSFIATCVEQIADGVQMSPKRVWSQWFKKEPRKLITLLQSACPYFVFSIIVDKILSP